MDKLAILNIYHDEKSYRFRLEQNFNPDNLNPGCTEYICSIPSQERRQLRNEIQQSAQGVLGAVELRRLGRLMFSQLLPEGIQQSLWNLDIPLAISTDDPGMPWEIIHNGQDFLCQKIAIGRQLVTGARHKQAEAKSSKGPAFLLISNPRGDLPESEEEANHIAEMLASKKISPVIFSGNQAGLIPVQVEIQDGDKYIGIHYAGHARYDSRTGEYGLLLANQSRLTASRIQNILCGQPVIFLNACGTDAGQKPRSRNADWQVSESLAEAFIRGGARAVIATRWPVADKNAALFSKHFYQFTLNEGCSIGESMRRTCLLFSSSFPGDLTWSAFVLYGDPRIHLLEPRELFLQDGHLNRNRFDATTQRAVEDLKMEAMLTGCHSIEPIHLLIVLTKIPGGLTEKALVALGKSAKSVRDGLRTEIHQEDFGTRYEGASSIFRANFTDESSQILISADRTAQEVESGLIGEAHLLKALIHDANPIIAQVLKKQGIRLENLDMTNPQEPEKNELFLPDGQVNLTKLTPSAQAILNGLVDIASQLGSGFLGTSHFLVALVANSQRLRQSLSVSGLNVETVVGQMRKDLPQGKKAGVRQSLVKNSFSPHMQTILSAADELANQSTPALVDDQHLARAYADNPEANSLALLEKVKLSPAQLVAFIEQPLQPTKDKGEAASTPAESGVPEPADSVGKNAGLFWPDGSLNFAVFDPSGKQVFELAAVEAQRSGQLIINTAHFFIGLTYVEGGATATGFAAQQISPSQVRKALRTVMDKMQPLPAPPPLTNRSIAPRVQELLKIAWELCASEAGGGRKIDERGLLAGFLLVKGSSTAQALASMGLQWPPLIAAAGLEGVPEVERGHSDQGYREGAVGQKVLLIDKIGRDLTQAARDGKLDQIIGRKDEIQRLVQTLSRQKKNNAIVIGEAGVGKTAIVEGLAQRIAEGKVPPQLKDRRIIEIPIASLSAGTQYRGQFEERLETLVAEAKQTGVILFFDEIHTLIGVGQTSGGSLDAANILKPALARGDLHCIGATTPEEFGRSIEKDKALERRFQPIYVNDLSPEATIEVLRVLKPKYESYYQVTIQEQVIELVVQLTMEYLPNRHQPDKAIDLLEETCVHVNTRQYRSSSMGAPQEVALDANVITPRAIVDVLSTWTGIPIGDLSVEAGERLADLEKNLSAIILGQAEAIKSASHALLIGKVGLRPPHRPLAVLLFTGPSGVGKTALAFAMAKEAFGTEDALFRLDMSEFSEQHSVAKLTGAPPGYIGYEQEGLLTGYLRHNSQGIVLFDEIEKAHISVFDLFLQLFDAGRLTDSQGRVANAQNFLYILTSNVALGIHAKAEIGFVPQRQKSALPSRQEVMTALAAHFRVEFLNRLDEVIVFQPLDLEVALQITWLKLREIQERLRSRGVTLEFDQGVAELITRLGFSQEFGARNLQRTIDQILSQPLSELIVRQKKGAYICKVAEDQLILEPLAAAVS